LILPFLKKANFSVLFYIAALHDLVGKTVGEARQLLKAVMGLPDNVKAKVNEQSVEPIYRLAEGDVLSFYLESGQKGVGDVWTPQEFMEKFNLTTDGWEALIEEGLPIQSMPNDEICIIEDEVDPWFYKRRKQKEYLKSLGGKKPRWFKRGQWYCLPRELPPPQFKFGPIDGTLQEIAAMLFPHLVDEEKDERHRCERAVRRLEKRASYEQIWVRRNSNSDWEAWFQDEGEFIEAKKNRMKAEE
jgi:hypothetical protein